MCEKELTGRDLRTAKYCYKPPFLLGSRAQFESFYLYRLVEIMTAIVSLGETAAHRKRLHNRYRWMNITLHSVSHHDITPVNAKDLITRGQCAQQKEDIT